MQAFTTWVWWKTRPVSRLSVDDRYGPVYNKGIATAIIDRMNAAHPIPRSHRQPLKIILIGTSGGAQVALGTVP